MQSKVRIGLFVALGYTSVLTVGFASFGFSKLAQSSAERSRREKDYPPIVLSESEAKKLDQLTSDMTIKPGIGVGPVRLMMTPEQVIEVLGKPEVRTDDPKRRQTMLAYRKLGLRMEFDRGSEELWAIICMASSKKTLFSQSSDPVATFGGATAEGVKIGLPFAEAKRILGEPLVSQKYPMLDMFPKDDNVIDPNSILESAYPKSLMVLVKDQKDIVEIHVVLPGHKNKPLDFR